MRRCAGGVTEKSAGQKGCGFQNKRIFQGRGLKGGMEILTKNNYSMQ
jgi:hypothetical protein